MNHTTLFRGSRCSVLVVDDEAHIREWLCALLEKNGCDVLVSHNGNDAIKMIQYNHIDVLITDIVMPECDGMEILRFARGRLPDVRIIAISGVTNADIYLTMAHDLGADAILQKPFKNRQLLDTMAGLISP